MRNGIVKDKTTSLRTQILTRLFTILIIITLVSGVIQLYFMNRQIEGNVASQSTLLSHGIQEGMAETRLASESIEHQIDLRLASYSKQIANKLKGQPLDKIKNDDLLKIKDELGISGITLFSRQEDGDIVGTKSTDPSEIGFSFKEIGYLDGYRGMDYLYNNKLVTFGTTYYKENIYVIPISQSGSHEDEPVFFKYAYYLEPGTNYVINAYIESNEIYEFTKEVGPDSWIERMKEKNDFIKEIAVLDPRVFENPDLETKLFPPLKKVVHGEYKYKDSKDEKILIDMVKNETEKVQYIKEYQDEKIYKMFLPTKDGQVVYIALDYGALSGPLYRHSIILIVSGLISLLALFLLTAGFFNQIYEKISMIKSQIKQLEAGDLTAKSTVHDRSELGILSESVNSMVDKWNKLVKDTQEQAIKTQRSSMILEAEASHSVEKMYELSTEATIKSREQLYEISEFLDGIMQALEPYKENKNIVTIMEEVEKMRQVANDRTAATTNTTITLSDLLQSLHGQSSELSDIAKVLLEHIGKFKL
jgi:methyl-accepting chemotaxis protein